MATPTNFFPSIGQATERTNALPDDPEFSTDSPRVVLESDGQLLTGEEGRAAREGGEAAPGFHDGGAVEQIESLCLECGEQVRSFQDE